MAKEKICGIYKIKNLVNGKIYIGSSIDIKERWHRHRTDLRCNTHGNSYLQNAWNKYGESSFSFEIIEEIDFVTKEYLLEREQYWIDILNVCNRKIGYNLSPTAGSPLGVVKTEEEKEKMRKDHKSKPIIQIDIDGNIIKRWYGIKEICKKTGFIYGAIRDAVKQLRGYLAYGYIWIYENDYDPKTFSVDYYINNKHQTKKVVQLSLEGKLIKAWNSLTEIIDNNPTYKISSLSNLCSKYRKSYKSYKGFLWMYEHDYLVYGTPKYFKLKGGKKEKVVQMNKDFKLIKIWDSISDAAKSFNITPATISDCARGKSQFSHGFRWIKKIDYDKGLLTRYIQKQVKYKSIVQLDLDSNYIRIWKSSKEIERELGFGHSGVQKCCKGQFKTANKYKWMYKEDYEKELGKLAS